MTAKTFRFTSIKLLIILFVLISMAQAGKAQLFNTPVSVGFGLRTATILGKNANTKPIASNDTNDRGGLGGSMSDAQPGIEFRSTFSLTKEDRFRIPVSLEYSFYTANERFPIDKYVEDYYHHSLNVFEASTGLHYVVKRVFGARAKIYTGLEAKGSYIHNVEYTITRNYFNLPNYGGKKKMEAKENAFRIGALGRIGVEGRLEGNWYVNTSLGLSAMNIFMRDDNRGELMTVQRLFEDKEALLWQFNFSLLIQYNF